MKAAFEVKQVTQQHIVTLQKQKVDSTEVVQLVEKLSKLEHSIKDNRRILGDGGQAPWALKLPSFIEEISAVVRRIILNLEDSRRVPGLFGVEDKIMILEKKIDAIADARHKARKLAGRHLDFEHDLLTIETLIKPYRLIEHNTPSTPPCVI